MNLELGGPNKSGYKFNEVTSITGVKPYVLRFWESEFEHIHPSTNELGQKIYTQLDIEAIQKVKRLLFDDKLTIPQAKGYLDRDLAEQSSTMPPAAPAADFMEQVAMPVLESEEAFSAFNFVDDGHDQLSDIELADDTEAGPPPAIPVEAQVFAPQQSDEERMALKTAELKKALDAIIERNSMAMAHKAFMAEAKLSSPEPVIEVKKKLVTQRLSDKDVVSLVSAKKKLSIVLGRIDHILSDLN